MSTLRTLAYMTFRQSTRYSARRLHVSAARRNEAGGFSNILAGSPAPAVQVKTITNEGIELEDGLILPGASIFLDGKVFLWDVPETRWEGWDKKHFEIFDVVVPKPGKYIHALAPWRNHLTSPVELLLIGTGKRVAFVPPMLRQYLTSLGIQTDIMDTVRAFLLVVSYGVLRSEHSGMHVQHTIFLLRRVDTSRQLCCP